MKRNKRKWNFEEFVEKEYEFEEEDEFEKGPIFGTVDQNFGNINPGETYIPG